MKITDNEYKILKAQIDACISAHKKEHSQAHIQMGSLKTITQWLCNKNNIYVDYISVKSKINDLRNDLDISPYEFLHEMEEIEYYIYKLLEIKI